MKKILIIFITVVSSGALRAQQLDSIYFNLYTDSLKIGTFNYINVEGRYNDGHYLPMSTKEIRLTSSAGTFEGNSLFVDSSFHDEKIMVRAFVPGNKRLRAETTIYIKKNLANERLPTVDEILNRRVSESPEKGRRSRRK